MVDWKNTKQTEFSVNWYPSATNESKTQTKSRQKAWILASERRKHRTSCTKTSELSRQNIGTFPQRSPMFLYFYTKITENSIENRFPNTKKQALSTSDFPSLTSICLQPTCFTKHINLKIFWQKKYFNNVIEQREERLCLLRLSRVVTEQGEAKLWSSESRSQVYLDYAESWQSKAKPSLLRRGRVKETKVTAPSHASMGYVLQGGRDKAKSRQPNLTRTENSNTPPCCKEHNLSPPLSHEREGKKGELLVFPNLNSPTFCHLL